MKTNPLLIFGAGLALGYFASHLMAPASKVGAYSLPCECSGGGTCNSGKSDCSCCKSGYGRVVQAYQTVPIQQRRTVGI